MAHTRTWNASYEASPADGDNLSEGDDRIRNFKTDIRERMALDHYMDIAGTDADHGEHVKVTLRVGSAPTHAADKGILYAKDVSSKAELHYIDEDGDEVQLTSGGAANSFPAGTSMIFYQAAAPTGWTEDTIQANSCLRVMSVSGGTGGSSGGTHDIDSPPTAAHTHTTPNHTHTLIGTNTAQTGGTFQYLITSLGTVSGGSGTTSSSGPTAFAPKYMDCICCTKD